MLIPLAFATVFLLHPSTRLLLHDTPPDAACEAALKLARALVLCVVEGLKDRREDEVERYQDEDKDRWRDQDQWQDEDDREQPTVDVVQPAIGISIIPSLLASTQDTFSLLNLRRRQAASILYALAYLSLARLMPSPTTTATIRLLLSSLSWVCRWVLFPLGIVAWLHFCLATFILHWGELEALCLCVASLSWIMSRLDTT